MGVGRFTGGREGTGSRRGGPKAVSVAAGVRPRPGGDKIYHLASFGAAVASLHRTVTADLTQGATAAPPGRRAVLAADRQCVACARVDRA